jgi:magnesium chelatase family protein
MILAANACPCGRLGIRRDDGGMDGYHETQSCLCSPEEISRYWRKFGGALLDRIEIRVAAIPPSVDEIGITGSGAGSGADSGARRDEERSADIAVRVKAAVEIQQLRYKGMGIRRNALIPAGKIETFCGMDQQSMDAFHKALARLGLSGRVYHGILRVARTIADLDGKETIGTEHILEAVQYRRYGEDPYEIITLDNR